jgi:hypothetical protein
LDQADDRCGFISQRKNVLPKATLLPQQVSPRLDLLLITENDWACDPPLLPPSLPSPPPKPVAVAPEPSAAQTPLPERSPLFRETLSDGSGSESDSDEELNMDKANQTWAKLMLELDTLRSGSDNKKGKKKKGPAVVLETPEIRRIKSDMAKVEKEYMFSRKEAGTICQKMMTDDRCHFQVLASAS